MAQMYTTGQSLSRGITRMAALTSLRSAVHGQNLPRYDDGAVKMIPLADLRDSHIEMVCDDAKGITFADSIMNNGIMVIPITVGRPV